MKQTYLLWDKWLEKAVQELQETEYQVTIHGRHDLLHLLTHKLNGRLEIENAKLEGYPIVRGYTHVQHHDKN